MLRCCERLEYNSQRCGVLRRVARAFLVAEARCALSAQASRTLSGHLEVDGTSIKKWRPIGSTTNYQQVFSGTCRASRKINLHEFDAVPARNFGKPPTESLENFQSSGAAAFIDRNAVILSDGCPSYVPWQNHHVRYT